MCIRDSVVISKLGVTSILTVVLFALELKLISTVFFFLFSFVVWPLLFVFRLLFGAVFCF